jgi:glycosyltransferase involved in cell wall biosynthesis
MRLVIDLQAAQGASSARGIGRYSRELALALARNPRDHQLIIALSGAFLTTAEDLIAKFTQILPRNNIRVWHPPRDTAPLIHGLSRRPFAETLRSQFLASLQPDLVHVCSLFDGWGDDVINVQPEQLQRLPVVATCYDLIPLLHHAEIFGQSIAPSPYACWYHRALQEMTLCEGLLAISESSRREAIDYLAFSPGRVFNISAGIGPEFHPTPLSAEDRAALLKRYGLREGFIMFLAAYSPIKNEEGLVAAYARLPIELQAHHQLLVAGDRNRETLYRTAARFGVPSENLVYVPFVREDDLRALYTVCGLFVCPSRHEGFGLPLAEAMACGAPAIASNTTSLPEVIGRDDATFDPEDPDAIAACIRNVLENPIFREELSTYGPIRAGRFTWQASAARAWDALETIHSERTQQGKTRVTSVLPNRPRLAYISPLPPQASGIADYSADLLPSLARYYDITLVSEEETTEPRLWAFPRLSPGDFLRKAWQFERVLYHIGNSPFHQAQIETLLPQCPGVVALHDAFLSAFMSWSAYERGRSQDFTETLLRAHGYPALRFANEHDTEATLNYYPCSLSVLQGAVGIIQHSRHGVDVLRQYFGEEATRNIAIVPLVRSRRIMPSRAAARAKFDLDDGELVVCSFGMVGQTKAPDLVANAWRLTGLKGRLVFVGDDGGWRQKLGDPAIGIDFTGRVTREEYVSWLAAADVAVQWRTGTRGETSAAVADTLMAGLPVILNRHGSAAELPEAVALSLPDDADSTALAAALVALNSDPANRVALGLAGQVYARQELAPETIALRYFEAIERAYALPSATVIAQNMPSDVLVTAGPPNGTSGAARSISRSFPSPWRGGGSPRLLIDLSDLARANCTSDKQRGLREIARRALEQPPQGWRGEAVRLDNGRLRHTYALPLAMLGLAPLDLPEVPVDIGGGDILLCADVSTEMTEVDYEELRGLRLEGLTIVLVIYDLLPLRHPNLFPVDTAELVAGWYRRMMRIADAAVCLSHGGANDLMAWLDAEPGAREMPLPISAIKPGADLYADTSNERLSPETLNAFDCAQKRPTVVMVVTAEQDKGYPQALAAFETLWKAGEDLGLIVIGKHGWKMEAFAGRLLRSPEAGQRLHWLKQCNNAELRSLYGASSGLLIASHHKSSDLLIYEALHAGLAVFARDRSALREIAGDQARYFSGEDPEELAEALRSWVASGFTPRPTCTSFRTWDDTFKEVCDLLLRARWDWTWRPGSRSGERAPSKVLKELDRFHGHS